MVRRAFTLVELLVVLGIIGVLVGLLLPAVNSAREALSRAECATNFRQLGIAMHTYHDVYGCLPPARVNPSSPINGDTTLGIAGMPLLAGADYYGGPFKILNHSGFVLLLPFIEEENLYRKFNLSVASCNLLGGIAYATTADLGGGGVNQGNAEVAETYVKAYCCPSDEEPGTDPIPGASQYRMRRSNYLFNVFSTQHEEFSISNIQFLRTAYGGLMAQWIGTGIFDMTPGVFGDNKRTRMTDIRNGASQTIAMGETRQKVWGNTTQSMYRAHWGVGDRACVTGATRHNASFDNQVYMNYPQGKIGGVAFTVDGGPSNDLYWNMSRRGYSSYHPNGCNFLMSDGSVQFLPNSTPHPVLQSMSKSGERWLIHSGNAFVDPDFDDPDLSDPQD